MSAEQSEPVVFAAKTLADQMHDRLAADAAKWREVIEKAGIPKE